LAEFLPHILCWGAYSAPPDPELDLGVLLLKQCMGGRTGEKAKEGERRVKEGKGKDGKRLPSIPPVPNLSLHHCVCLQLRCHGPDFDTETCVNVLVLSLESHVSRSWS